MLKYTQVNHQAFLRTKKKKAKHQSKIEKGRIWPKDKKIDKESIILKGAKEDKSIFIVISERDQLTIFI